MADPWHYEIDGDVHGPVDWDELRRLARAGRIGPTTLLRQGRENWIAARHVPGLLEGIAAQPGPDEPPGRRQDYPGTDRPIRQLDDPAFVPDYRLPPRSTNGFVTAYGVVTLVLAGLLTLTGCLSGGGSLLLFSYSNALLQPPASTASSGSGSGGAAASSGCNAFFAAIFLGIAIVLAIVTVVHVVLAGGHFTVGIGVLRRRAWARILALVVSFFSLSYGGVILYLIAAAVMQN
ncbi:MAG TPA: DUF4339 domain-containing protein, partial [Gemmataceae bacterium]|nr:DUF4339 domain-containing protein [Gemmataceae bacterium]